MSKRKTQYTINFTVDTNLVNNIITNWLIRNGFYYREEDGCSFYRAGDGLISGFRCFEYYIRGNQLTILAYLKSPKNPIALDTVGATPYVDIIEELTNTICNAGINQSHMQVNYQSNFGQQTYNNVQTYDEKGNTMNTSFFAQNDARKGKCASLALFISIACLFIGLMAKTYGIAIVIGAYCLGVEGLKSSKKNIAVAAIVITTIGVLLWILTLSNIIPAI